MAKLFKNIWKKMTLQGSDDKTPSCGWNMLRPLVSASNFVYFQSMCFFPETTTTSTSTGTFTPFTCIAGHHLMKIRWAFEDSCAWIFHLKRTSKKLYIYIYNSSFEKSQQQQKWIWPTQNQYEIKQIQTIIGLILWYTLLSLLNDTCTRLH